MICYLNPIWTNSFIKHISEHALYIHFTVILGNKVSALNLCAKNLTLFFCSTYNQRVLIDCNPLCFYSPFSPRYKSSEQILFASCHFFEVISKYKGHSICSELIHSNSYTFQKYFISRDVFQKFILKSNFEIILLVLPAYIMCFRYSENEYCIAVLLSF